jgi:hypothetical protein
MRHDLWDEIVEAYSIAVLPGWAQSRQFGPFFLLNGSYRNTSITVKLGGKLSQAMLFTPQLR